MNLSRRTRLSLGQLLVFLGREQVGTLFEKHGIELYAPQSVEHSKLVLDGFQPAQFAALLDEMVRTRGTLRYYSDSAYVFEELWDDLQRCLALDGYRIEDKQIVRAEPSVEEAVRPEDDLASELRRSALPQAEEVIRLFDSSAEAYRKTPPAYNACLTDARIALETIAKDIAEQRLKIHPSTFDPTKWGSVLNYLKTSSLITTKEEDVLAGVYGFVSEGAHRPVGFSDEEMTLLGRRLVVSIRSTTSVDRRPFSDQIVLDKVRSPRRCQMVGARPSHIESVVD